MNLAIDTINIMSKHDVLPQMIGTKEQLRGKKWLSLHSPEHGRQGTHRKQVSASVEVHGLRTPSRLNMSIGSQSVRGTGGADPN